MKTKQRYQPHLVVNEMKLRPGGEWSPQLAGWSFIQVTSGSGYWVHPRINHELGPGTLLVLSQRMRGRILASQVGPEVVLHFFRLEPELMTGLVSLRDQLQFDALAAKDKLALQIFPPADPRAGKFKEIIAHRNGNGFLRLELLELFVEVFGDEFKQLEVEAEPSPGAKQRLKDILKQTTVAELLHLSFSDLVEMTGCTDRHLSRIFHELVGMSYRDKYTEIRLARASELLATSESKVVDVALESGYQSLGLFSAMFKRRFGVSPGKWRERLRKREPSQDSARPSQVLRA